MILEEIPCFHDRENMESKGIIKVLLALVQESQLAIRPAAGIHRFLLDSTYSWLTAEIPVHKSWRRRPASRRRPE